MDRDVGRGMGRDVDGGRTLMGEARAPGTCGELVQGAIGGVSFLVTCPIDCHARVQVVLRRDLARLDVWPRSPKVALAVCRTMAYLGAKGWGGVVRVESAIPRGKGMASSSAEIAAACQATARALGRRLTGEEIARLALSIEPTDGVMYPGIVQLDHVGGSFSRRLGAPSPMDLLLIDLGGRVDTLAFNRRGDMRRLNARKEPLVREALDLVEKGVERGAPELVGRGATLSALAHQEILPKPLLPRLLVLAGELGAVGVNVAHSGTVAGLMFAGRPGRGCEEEWLDEAGREVHRRFGLSVRRFRLIGGGVV